MSGSKQLKTKGHQGYLPGGKADVAWWAVEIEKGIAFRRAKAFEGSWERWRKFYRGEYGPDVLPVNLFFKMVRTLVPRVYFRNPSVAVSPTKPGDLSYALAQVLERVDNKLLRTMKVKETIKMMVQSGFMYGTGVGKIGYGAEYTPTPDYLGTAAPTGKGRKRPRLEYDDRVKANMPWFLPVRTGDFVVPTQTDSIHSARWVANRFKRHIDDLRADPRIDHALHLDSNRGGMQFSTRSASAWREDDDGMVELFEVRDKRAAQVFVIAPYNSNEVLLQDDDGIVQDGGFNYLPLVFNADDESFWGLPDAQILDPQQREINENRTLVMKHRRLSLVKWLVEMGAMTPDEEQKLVSEGVVPVVHVTDGAIAKLLKVESADIPRGLLTADHLVQQEAQELMGLGANQFGEYAPGSADRSATEANIVNQATAIRTDERRDAVADLLVELIEKVNPILFDHWTGDQVADIVGPGGVRIWVAFRPEELKGSGYNVSIDPDSSLPETKSLKEAKALKVYEVLKTNPIIEPLKLTNYLLRAFHGAEFDDMVANPEEVRMMQQQAAGGAAGATPGNPINVQQLAGILPQLRGIAGGRQG